MEEDYSSRIYYYGALLAIIFVGLAFIIGHKKNDIDFCRDVFAGLIKGDYSVQQYIDWNNFKGLDTDVGTTYFQLPNEKERTAYRKAFIKGVSMGFQNGRVGLDKFTHWRVYNKAKDKVIIATDFSKKVLLFEISKGAAGRTLTSLQWR